MDGQIKLWRTGTVSFICLIDTSSYNLAIDQIPEVQLL